MKNYKLIAQNEAYSDLQITIEDNKNLLVGRSQQCDFILEGPTISRQHCIIKSKNGLIKIQDISNSNGVYVNGKRITESVINESDIILIGSVEFQMVQIIKNTLSSFRTTVAVSIKDVEKHIEKVTRRIIHRKQREEPIFSEKSANKKQERDLSLLHTVGKSVYIPEIKVMLGTILESVMQSLKIEKACIIIPPYENKSELTIFRTFEQQKSTFSLTSFPVVKPILNDVLKQAQAIITTSDDNVKSLQDIKPYFLTICAPIEGKRKPKKNNVIGVIYLDRPLASFDKHDLNLVTAIGRQIGLAIEHKWIEEELQKAGRHKSEFLATMSHEIRTPMNAVIGISELLNRTSLDQDQEKYVKVLLDSSQHLLHLVNDILDFSQIESNKLKLQKEVLNIKECVVEIINIFKVQAEEKNLSLDYEFDNADQTPHFFQGDKKRIQQILSNLISNAIKFTEKGYIIVNIKIQKKKLLQANIFFTIKDTGIGIPEDQQTLLFDRFTQIDTNLAESKGTGLGLAICKELVKLMEGKISVKSKIGWGTEFSFSINIPIATPTEKRKKLLEKETEKLHFSEQYPLKILLAEDHKVNQMVIKNFFDILEYSIDIVDNGKEAITHLNNKNYDLILTDLHMPVVNGTQVAQYVSEHKNLNKRSLVVMLTADVFSNDKKYSLLEKGIHGFLNKPITLESLRDTLKMCSVKSIFRKEITKSFTISNVFNDKNVRGMDSKTLSSVFETFRDVASKSIKIIKQSLKENNTKLIVKEVHHLKGACFQLGAQICASVCQQIEIKAKEKKPQGLEFLIDSLEEHYYYVCKELNNYKTK